VVELELEDDNEEVLDKEFKLEYEEINEELENIKNESFSVRCCPLSAKQSCSRHHRHQHRRY